MTGPVGKSDAEKISFTVRIDKEKYGALEAIRLLLNARTMQSLVARYIDEGIQRDLDPEKTEKLFEGIKEELDRLRDAI